MGALYEDKKELQVTIGRMYWDTFRNLLDQIRVRGIPLECNESSGFLNKTFTIKTDTQTVLGLNKIVTDWANNARDDTY